MQMRRGQCPVRNVQRATDVRLHTSVPSSVPGGHTALRGQRHALPVWMGSMQTAQVGMMFSVSVVLVLEFSVHVKCFTENIKYRNFLNLFQYQLHVHQTW